MSKILITGAAGFIGSQLAYRFWKDGEEVILLDDFSYGKEDNLIFDDHIFTDEILRMDIREKDKMEELFQNNNFDYVYHIAAITPLPDCQTKPMEAVDINVHGTVIILELARKYGVKNIIFASTSAVYENCIEFPTKEGDVKETTLVYSTSKFTAEQFCKAYAVAYGMNVTVLRFANVYGPHIDCLRVQPPVAGYIIRELFYDRAVELHSDGNQRRDFVYVDDLIELAILVRDSKGFDIFNVSTGETHSINEMCDTIKTLMDKIDAEVKYLDTSHYWYRYPELYEGAYPIDAKIMENEVVKHTECDNTHAYDKYGWKPKTDFAEGLKKTIDFSVKVIAENA